jgi:RNA recognition motif-containing protein
LCAYQSAVYAFGSRALTVGSRNWPKNLSRRQNNLQFHIIEEAIMNLFVANFDDDITEADLDELFRDYGKVTNARIWIDFETGTSLGFGFVEIKDDWDADRAIEELDGKRWHGQYLKVSEARNPKW